MNDATSLLALFGLAAVATITPGPNNLMTMTSGANFGFRRTVPHMLGILIGFQVMLILVGVGVMQLLAANPAAFTVLKVLSAVYLVYLAFRMATASPSLETSSGRSRPLTFLEAALFQWVNPKAWTMALTTNGMFVPEDAPVRGVALVALAFLLSYIPAGFTWTYAGTRIRALLSTPLRLRTFNVVAGLLLLTTLYPIAMDAMNESDSAHAARPPAAVEESDRGTARAY